MNRIIGIDTARALAVIGMIIVNFKVVFGTNGSPLLQSIAGFFDGKAAATFVTLAGVGIALMTKSALKNKSSEKLTKIRKNILKRSLLLFLLGLSYMEIWPADILHFYGVYMAVLAFLLTLSSKFIFRFGLAIVFLFPCLLLFLNYELGWNFQTLEYQDFWTFKGFIRNLFFNGFHPVLPWIAFLFSGYWLGHLDLSNTKTMQRIAIYSFVVFISIQGLSTIIISFLTQQLPQETQSINELFSTAPMPPLPLYMLNGISFSFFIITTCILVSKKFGTHPIIISLQNMGKLALTFYVAHVIIGMGIIDLLYPNSLGTYSIIFSFMYALSFSILCLLFAYLWLKKYKSGPLEWIFRKLTN